MLRSLGRMTRSVGSFFPLCLLSFTLVSQTAAGLCVKTKRANLRSGPSTNYPVSWEVYRYMPFTKIKRKGKWYKVKDLDGDTHWIFSKLVTSRFRCAVVKSKRVNLRTGPGTRHPASAIYPSAKKYESFKVIKRKKGWALLEDTDGDKVWAYDKYLWMR